MLKDDKCEIAVAVFVKTPGLTPLKTRLARDIGNTKSIDFYLLSLKCISQTLKECNITPYWAVAEMDALNSSLWKDFQTIHVGEGDLGQIQSQIYNKLLKKHKRVILLGSDTPQISKTNIDKAINILIDSEFVFGPAFDGGYYLFGGRAPISNKTWQNINWSTNTTLKELQSKLSYQPKYLQYLTDVDSKQDLHKIIKEMPSQKSVFQNEICDWIHSMVNARN